MHRKNLFLTSAYLLSTLTLSTSCDSQGSGEGKTSPITVFSHNTGGINASFVEFVTPQNQALVEAVAKVAENKKVSELVIEANLTDLLAIANANGPDVTMLYNADEDKRVAEVLKEKAKEKFSALDRKLKSPKRYTPIGSQDIGETDLDAYKAAWLGKFSDPEKEAAFQKAVKASKGDNHAIFALFLFDCLNYEGFKAFGVDEVKKVRNDFYNTALGDTAKKAARIAAIAIQEQKADVLLFQEAVKGLKAECEQKDFHVVASEEEGESLICLKKEKWEAPTALTLELETPSEDGGKTKETIQKRIVAVKAKNKGDNKEYVLVSVHADSKGKWAPSILDAVGKLMQDGTPLILGMDANTNKEGGKVDKAEGKAFLDKATGLGLAAAFGNDPATPITTSKTRSKFSQTQLAKGGEKAEGRSDWLLSKGLEVAEYQRIEERLDADKNPSDHSPLVVSFK
ncbi:MAG: hypothetical protein ROO73_02645 [Roseivirga sp.]